MSERTLSDFLPTHSLPALPPHPISQGLFSTSNPSLRAAATGTLYNFAAADSVASQLLHTSEDLVPLLLGLLLKRLPAGGHHLRSNSGTVSGGGGIGTSGISGFEGSGGSPMTNAGALQRGGGGSPGQAAGADHDAEMDLEAQVNVAGER